jgi:hypothetical protein
MIKPTRYVKDTCPTVYDTGTCNRLRCEKQSNLSGIVTTVLTPSAPSPFLFYSSPSATLGDEISFFYFETSSPSATLAEEIHFFLKTSSPSAHAQALGEAPFVFLNSLPRVPNAQALREAPCPFF